MAKKSFKKGVKNVINSDSKADNPQATQNTNSSTMPVQVDLGAAFTVQNAETARQQLNSLLQGQPEVTVKSPEVTEIDVSYIQLFVAFEKEADRKNIKVNWDIRLSEETANLLKGVGMCHIMTQYQADEA